MQATWVKASPTLFITNIPPGEAHLDLLEKTLRCVCFLFVFYLLCFYPAISVRQLCMYVYCINVCTYKFMYIHTHVHKDFLTGLLLRVGPLARHISEGGQTEFCVCLPRATSNMCANACASTKKHRAQPGFIPPMRIAKGGAIAFGDYETAQQAWHVETLFTRDSTSR
jgi:hypothetical protein